MIPSILPLRIFASIGLTLTARTRIRTCPGPGEGTSSCEGASTSGWPYREKAMAPDITAVIRAPYLVQDGRYGPDNTLCMIHVPVFHTVRMILAVISITHPG
jgi:hypothetical protein